jgi:carboxylate-amine ligase
MLDLIAEDAEVLGCVEEVAHVRTILERGTSAHRQINAYNLAEAAGASPDEALKNVVDMLISDTAEGL